MLARQANITGRREAVTVLDGFIESLNSLGSQLNEGSLDPDPARTDWAQLKNPLDRIARTVRDWILERSDEALAEIEDPEERAAVQEAAAQLATRAAALLLAAGRMKDGQEIITRLIPLAEGTTEEPILNRAKLQPGDFIQLQRAYWLLGHKRHAEAQRISKELVQKGDTAVAREAQQILEVPRPMSRAPALFTFYGFGLSIYGRRDGRSDGSYVATRYLTGLYFPLLPVDAFRVTPAEEEGSYYFLGKARLSPVTRAWRVLVPILVVLGLAGYYVNEYLDSPRYRLARDLEAARAAEQAARTPAQRQAVIKRYEQLIEDHADTRSADLEAAGAGVARLASAAVAEPLKPADVDKARRVVRRFLTLPATARGGAASTAMINKLEAWTDQLGTKKEARLEAALRLLDDARQLARDTEHDARVRQRRAGLVRRLAGRLAAAWPLEAIRLYAGLGADREALLAAGKLVQKLPPGPSVLLDLEHELRTWDRQRTEAKLTQLDTLAQMTLERLDRARAHVAQAEYKSLLQSDDEARLQQALAKSPSDQGLATALARLQRAGGRSAAARKTLEGLGPPGHLVQEAQLALAAVYTDLGRLEQAEALLERQLNSQLPGFEAARRAYNEAVERRRDQLVQEARSGQLPADLSSRLQNASEDKQGEIFGEWLAQQLKQDPALTRLQMEYHRQGDVVPVALSLGTVKLRRASRARGARRQALLAGAERVFLSIQSEAQGAPSFHLGLGQVYHRLGKREEGERELKELLARNKPELSLAVGRAYRELGLIKRARTVAQAVYDQGTTSQMNEAAVLMALMATDRDQREAWFRKADQTDPFVKNNLLELEAGKALRGGKLDEADRKFAQVTQSYARSATRSSAAANNAGLAQARRYICTGEISHLDESIKYLESARRLQPDSSLVIANLASIIDHHVVLDVLGKWIRIRVLGLNDNEASRLIGALAAGPLRAEVLKLLRQDTRVRRLLDLQQQQEVLAPGRTGPYTAESGWYALLDDLQGMKQLKQRLDRVTALDTTDQDANLEKWLAGADDADRLENLRQHLARLDRLQQAAKRAGHKPTLAAVWLLKARTYLSLATIDNKLESIGQAVQAARTAHRLWPAVGASNMLANALVHSAILEAASRSPRLARLWKREGRRYGSYLFLHRVSGTAADLLPALRASPALREAVTLRKAALNDRPDLADWMLARAGGDASFTAATCEAFKRPLVRLGVEVDARLAPNSDSSKLMLKVLAAGP
jgi:hypothetical protein